MNKYSCNLLQNRIYPVCERRITVLLQSRLGNGSGVKICTTGRKEEEKC